MEAKKRNILLGAAFLMATSAIGPGFLTQTTIFTGRLKASFGFVILLSILLDMAAQLNIWRIITVSGKRAQDIANELLPGLGYFLALLIVLGGLAFNIGNVAGAGLGLNVLLGIPVDKGAFISAIVALFIFLYREAGIAMDRFTQVLGFAMIGLTLYVAFTSHPPIGEAIYRSVWPSTVDFAAIITLVGGTVGGYISFAGAHRLMDAGLKGKESLPEVGKSAVSAIGLTALMRILLFLASLGIVMQGLSLDPSNPPASVFRQASGQLGYKIFGIVMWSAAITSVVGSAFTSVSFVKTFHPLLNKYYRVVIMAFICISTIIFLKLGQPVKILVVAGALNAFILPIALLCLLVAVHKKKIVGDYKHPLVLTLAGAVVILLMAWMCLLALKDIGNVF